MNKSFFSTQKKLGILGGGQLGKMLLQTTRTWDIYTKVLDPDNEAPARLACNEFHVGSLMDYDTVFNFGKDCDVVTIEIEHVNVHALQALKKQGVTVHPDPNALEIINDKGLQKMFFKANDLPTSDFMFFENKEDVIKSLNQGDISLPFVQKSRKDGYDGRGVQIVNIAADTERLLNGSCLVEDKVDLKMEIAIIASRNIQGQVACYDAVAMDFVEGANMLDLLLYPVAIDATLVSKAKDIASALIQKLNICGLLAVEFFIDKKDTIYINEIAPRPHNSGHQTIESSETSQYEQHLRGILDLPLGSTNVTIPSVMVNLLGAEGYSGNVYYEQIEECMATEGVHVHIYGKKQTRPFRKMGHVTVTNKSLDQAKKIAQWVKQTLIVKSL
jgi:5-(carboxyamino)imidazole ribonucleotide synthase